MRKQSQYRALIQRLKLLPHVATELLSGGVHPVALGGDESNRQRFGFGNIPDGLSAALDLEVDVGVDQTLECRELQLQGIRAVCN